MSKKLKTIMIGLMSTVTAILLAMVATSYDQATSNIRSYSGFLEISYSAYSQWIIIGKYIFFGGVILALMLLFLRGEIRSKVCGWIQGVTWCDKSFLNINAQKHMIGISEDMVIYGDIEYRITRFCIQGKNHSNKTIDNVSGYIQSNKTGLVIPVLLDGMEPDETYGIPPKCDFYVAAIFPKSSSAREGYSIEDFWRHMGEFTFVFKYGDKTYTKKYSTRKLQVFIDLKVCEMAASLAAPKSKPRVKKKVPQSPKL